MAAIDETAKLADILGMQVETLTAYQHAAKIAGVEQSQLTTGMQKLTQATYQAQLGLRTSLDAFSALGIKAESLKGLSTDQVLERVADGMAGIKDTTTRAGVALALFGRSGLGMVKLLERGSEGLAEARREAARLGITFSRLDAAKVEAANDAIVRLKASLTGVGNQLAIGIAPLIATAADKFAEFAAAGDISSSKITQGLVSVVDAAGRGYDVLKSLFEFGRAGFEVMIGQFLKMQSAFLSQWEDKINGAAKALGSEFRISLVPDGMNDFGDELVGDAFKRAEDAAKRFASAFSLDIHPAAQAVLDSIAAIEASMKNIKEIAPTIELRKLNKGILNEAIAALQQQKVSASPSGGVAGSLFAGAAERGSQDYYRATRGLSSAENRAQDQATRDRKKQIEAAEVTNSLLEDMIAALREQIAGDGGETYLIPEG